MEENPAKRSVAEKRKIAVFRLFLILFTILLPLIFCEILFRIPLIFKSRNSFDAIMKNLPDPEKGVEVSLIHMVRPNTNRKIVFEFRPGIDKIFKNVPVKINSKGWRDREYQISRLSGTKRIVGLGDSFMLGWGVDQEQNYLALLEKKLNSLRFAGHGWEIINTAVPGYNTVMEVETLKEKALVFNPDVVLMEFVYNDLDMPAFVYEIADPFSLKELYSINFLVKGAHILRRSFELFIPPQAEGTLLEARQFDDYWKKIPEKYKNLVGYSSFTNALLELKSIREKYGFKVIFYMTHHHPVATPEKIALLCRRFGFYLLKDIQDISKPYLILSKKDPHPSALAHKLKAKAVLDYLSVHPDISN